LRRSVDGQQDREAYIWSISNKAPFMPETDDQPDNELDELEKAGRLNFRDYPSSGLVVIAALSSGLGWMLFKWLGKKRKGRSPAQAESSAEKNPTPEANSAGDQSS
jgi:hypothetical protein